MAEIISVIAERLGMDEGMVGKVVESVFGFLRENPEQAMGLLGQFGLGDLGGLGDVEELGAKLGKLFGS